MAAKLTLLNDRGYGDMSLLVLDLASGEAQRGPASRTNWQSVRWASDGRTLLALTDLGGSNFLRLCRMDPDNGAVSVVYAADGRDVEAWSLSSRWRDARDGRERSRLCACCGSGRRTASARSSTGLPRGVISEPGFVAGRHKARVHRGGADRSGVALAVARRAVRPVWQPDVTLDFVDLELVAWPSFDGARIPGWLALPAARGPRAGYPAVIWVHGGPVGRRRGQISGPTSRCCWRRASRC